MVLKRSRNKLFVRISVEILEHFIAQHFDNAIVPRFFGGSVLITRVKGPN